MAKILLVEDSEPLLPLLHGVLVEAGHDVVAASSGQRAMRELRSTTFDLVVTDVYMPPPDGFEVIQAVRALPRRIPLIAMSANRLTHDVLRPARALGALATLQKPFTQQQLLDAVRGALEAQRA